jgi:hypothetical protein
LSLYKDSSLVDIQLYNPQNKDTLLFSAVFNTGNALLLDGKPDIIHSINPYLLASNNKNLL